MPDTAPDKSHSQSRFGFKLADCPRHDLGSHPRAPHATHYAGWQLSQESGRILRLASLYQYNTYGGMLCGLPKAQDHHLEWAAVRAAELHFEHLPAGTNSGVSPHLVLLPPQLLCGTFAQRDAKDISCNRPWLALPAVCSIARLDSGELAPRANNPFSSVITVWWQDHYGPPDERATSQLKSMPWESFAWGWMA